MKIYVHAKPKSREGRVEKIDETHFKVWVKEAPQQGKANEAVIKALAEYLDIAPSRMRVARGESAKQKTIEIE